MSAKRRPVVVGSGDGAADVGTRGPVSRMFIVAGSAFALVGTLDLLLLWMPVRLDNLAWEYATVARTFDAIPMPVLGLLLIAFGSLRQGKVARRRIRLVAAAFFALGILSAALGLLLLTSVPAVLSQTPPEAAEAARRAAARHATQAVVYPVAWLAVAVGLWKARAQEGAP